MSSDEDGVLASSNEQHNLVEDPTDSAVSETNSDGNELVEQSKFFTPDMVRFQLHLNLPLLANCCDKYLSVLSGEEAQTIGDGELTRRGENAPLATIRISDLCWVTPLKRA